MTRVIEALVIEARGRGMRKRDKEHNLNMRKQEIARKEEENRTRKHSKGSTRRPRSLTRRRGPWLTRTQT